MGFNQSGSTLSYPGLGNFRAMKELTFSNDSGTLTLFTVTGDVRANVIALCKTALTSVAGANIRLGIQTDDNAFLVDLLTTDLEANRFWNSKSPDAQVQPKESTRGYDISNSRNIILYADAQVDSGAITFYCYWFGHSGGSSVIAA